MQLRNSRDLQQSGQTTPAVTRFRVLVFFKASQPTPPPFAVPRTPAPGFATARLGYRRPRCSPAHLSELLRPTLSVTGSFPHACAPLAAVPRVSRPTARCGAAPVECAALTLRSNTLRESDRILPNPGRSDRLRAGGPGADHLQGAGRAGGCAVACRPRRLQQARGCLPACGVPSCVVVKREIPLSFVSVRKARPPPPLATERQYQVDHLVVVFGRYYPVQR